MEAINKFFSVIEKKEVNQEERSIVAWGSRPVLDRDFEQISSEAKWELGNFQKNPVLMLSHDYSKPPVGKVIWTKVTSDGLRFKAQFAKTPAGEELWTLYRDGIMHSFSIGFLPLKFTEPDTVKSGEARRIYDHLELLEISCVSVPSCPAAVLDMYDAGNIKTKDISDVLAIIKETPHEQIETEEKTVSEEEQEPGAGSDGQQEEQKEVELLLDTKDPDAVLISLLDESEERALQCTCEECGNKFSCEEETCPTTCPACSKEDEDKPAEVEEDACGGKPKKPKKGVEPEDIEAEDIPVAMSKSIKDEYKAERWNKSLSKTFDIQNVPSQPANYTMKIFCQFLECKVKNIYQNNFFIPSPMIGPYLAGFKACSKDFSLKDTRAFSKYEQLEFPPAYEVIRINSKTQDDFLVDGSAFYDFKGEPIILDFSPDYWGLNVSVFTSRKNMSLSKEFMSAVHNWVENENPLKDEKMALTGEFLEVDPNDTWETIVLDEKNLAAGKLAEKLINEKEMDFSGRGMLLLGVPGTGKTKLARILMTQTKHTFLWVSSKDLTMTPYPEDKIALGFKLARQLAPCILCLEDIDNWISGKIVDMMKTELDGVKKNKGVITIMTTNFPEKLPQALLDRPGRFHDVLHFDVPTKELRKEMLERWVGDLDKDLLEDVLVQTEGYSGAYMWELIEYAKAISSDEDLPIDKALQKSLEKLANQKELIQQIRQEKKEFDPGDEIIISPKEEDIVLETKDVDEVDIEIETKEIDFEIEHEEPRTIELNMDEVQSALKDLVGDFLSKRPDIADLVDERIRRAQGKMV